MKLTRIVCGARAGLDGADHSCRSVAEVAAYLQGRPWERAQIVVPFEEFDIDAVLGVNEWLARHAGERLVSFATGETGADLAASVAKGALPRRGDAKRLLIASKLPLNIWPSLAGHEAVTRLEAGSAAATLSEWSEAMLVAAHSSGIDIDVGGASLCARRALSGSPHIDLRRTLPCWSGAECQRKSIGSPEFAAEALKATGIVALSCWTVMPQSGQFDRRAAIGNFLMRLPGVESIVTSARVLTLDESDLNLACCLILEGRNWSEIALELNRYRMDQGRTPDLLCVGNPMYTVRARSALVPERAAPAPLPPRGASVVVKAKLEGPERREATRWLAHCASASVDGGVVAGSSAYIGVSGNEGDGRVRAEAVSIRPGYLDECGEALDFLRWFARGLPSTNDDDVRRRLEAACDGLTALFTADPRYSRDRATVLGAVLHDELRRRESELVAAVAAALHDFYAAYCRKSLVMPPSFVWQRFYAPEAQQRMTGRCAYCSSGVDTLVHRAKLGHSRRYILMCRGCGPIFDGPARMLASSLEIGEGAPHRLEARIANAPAAPMHHLSVEFALNGFGQAPPVQATKRAERGARDLKVVLAVPDALARGTYPVGGMLVEDLNVAFLRRPIAIDGSGDGAPSSVGRAIRSRVRSA